MAVTPGNYSHYLGVVLRRIGPAVGEVPATTIAYDVCAYGVFPTNGQFNGTDLVPRRKVVNVEITAAEPGDPCEVVVVAGRVNLFCHTEAVRFQDCI